MYVLLDVSVYLCYLCRLIKPVVTAEALFHVRLSGFHFKDVWKSCILTERYNIFYMGVRVGISELLTELLFFVWIVSHKDLIRV